MKQMDYVKKYVDKRHTKYTTFDELAGYIEDAKREYKIMKLSELIVRLRKQKNIDQAFKSNWEVDYHYETRLKQYDQEKWI